MFIHDLMVAGDAVFARLKDNVPGEKGMRCLTLSQPWATLVAIGAKKIETRSWSTSYRGPLAIHAAKGFPKSARNLCFASPFRDYLRDIIIPIGAVIATCELVGVLRVENLTAARANTWVAPNGKQYCFYLDLDEQAFGDYTRGRYAWLLDDVKTMEPITAKGALSLWEWNPQDATPELVVFAKERQS